METGNRHKFVQVRDFARIYIDTENRIQQLKELIEKASISGGIITLDRDTLQDGFMDVSIPPSVVVPYLNQELEQQVSLFDQLEAQMGKILVILKKEDSHG